MPLIRCSIGSAPGAALPLRITPVLRAALQQLAGDRAAERLAGGDEVLADEREAELRGDRRIGDVDGHT